MRILCNGEGRDVADSALTAALSVLGFRDAIVATALNGEFVPVGSRSSVHLKEGDQLEVLAPMQGG
jgi:sulfur carrier protein